MQPLSFLSRSPDPTVAQAADEFATAFTRTQELMRVELAESGEVATIRRVLHHGYAMDRAALIAILGHGKKFVVRLGCSPDDAGALACDARTKAFLRGLIGEGPRLGVETLRPLRPVLEDTAEEDLAVFNTEDHSEAPQLVDHREAP